MERVLLVYLPRGHTVQLSAHGGNKTSANVPRGHGRHKGGCRPARYVPGAQAIVGLTVGINVGRSVGVSVGAIVGSADGDADG